MKLPISYALDPQKAVQSCLIPPLCPAALPALRLEPIDPARYPLWHIKDEILHSPKLGAILNASNEILVQNFLKDKIRFGTIASHILKTLEHFAPIASSLNDLESILELDKEVRIYTQNLLQWTTLKDLDSQTRVEILHASFATRIIVLILQLLIHDTIYTPLPLGLSHFCPNFEFST